MSSGNLRTKGGSEKPALDGTVGVILAQMVPMRCSRFWKVAVTFGKFRNWQLSLKVFQCVPVDLGFFFMSCIPEPLSRARDHPKAMLAEDPNSLTLSPKKSVKEMR